MDDYNERQTFGMLIYEDTHNVGDEIQSLAAQRFLPAIDYHVNREKLSDFRKGSHKKPVKLIMNGWYAHHPENWPPSDDIYPLLVSVHLSLWRNTANILLSGKNRDFFKRNQPVGARDLHTLDLLQSAGIESFFSGCLTLTLERLEVAREDGLVVLTDIPDSITKQIQERVKNKIQLASHVLMPNDVKLRFSTARHLLSLYASASCVITTKLHCALPCLALGTPVLLIVNAEDKYRFSGLSELVHTSTFDELFETHFFQNMDNPIPNSEDFHALRDSLIRRSSSFCRADV